MTLLLEYLCSLEMQHLATHVLISNVKEFKQKIKEFKESKGLDKISNELWFSEDIMYKICGKDM